MYQLRWAWKALLLMLTMLALPLSAFAQEGEELPARYRVIEDRGTTVPCGDRACRVFRLGVGMQSEDVGRIFLLAQRRVEQNLNRTIVQDANWHTYTTEDMMAPFAPRIRRNRRGQVVATLPAILRDEAQNAAEIISLESIFAANDGENGSHAPFQVVARNGHRHYTGIAFNHAGSARRRGLPEAVTLANVVADSTHASILATLGVTWTGRISMSDNLNVRIPTTGGLTVGERIANLVQEGRRAMAPGVVPAQAMTIALLNRHRVTFRELRNRRGVFVEAARRDAFDTYVDDALTYIEQHPVVATATVARPAPVQTTTTNVASSRPAPSSTPTIQTVEKTPFWMWVALGMMACASLAFFVGYMKERKRQRQPPPSKIEKDEDVPPVVTALRALPDDKTERLVNGKPPVPIEAQAVPPPNTAEWEKKIADAKATAAAANQRAADVEKRLQAADTRCAAETRRANEAEARVVTLTTAAKASEERVKAADQRVQNALNEAAEVKRQADLAVARADKEAAHSRKEEESAKEKLNKKVLEDYGYQTEAERYKSKHEQLVQDHVRLKAAFKGELLTTDDLLRVLYNETVHNPDAIREARTHVGGLLQLIGVDIASVPPPQPPPEDEEATKVRELPPRFTHTLAPPAPATPTSEPLKASLGDRMRQSQHPPANGSRQGRRKTTPGFDAEPTQITTQGEDTEMPALPPPGNLPNMAAAPRQDPREDTKPMIQAYNPPGNSPEKKKP